jgi:hypothetical protein
MFTKTLNNETQQMILRKELGTLEPSCPTQLPAALPIEQNENFMKEHMKSIEEGFAQGRVPHLTQEGTSGTYIL